jgi:hypothetical protein
MELENLRISEAILRNIPGLLLPKWLTIRRQICNLSVPPGVGTKTGFSYITDRLCTESRPIGSWPAVMSHMSDRVQCQSTIETYALSPTGS